ncbi:MAG: hypothetical protein JRM77_09760 [Nitrososphaerota archaeon]|nr:hypothetical protein [Nitrososphaerota archaeon]
MTEPALSRPSSIVNAVGVNIGRKMPEGPLTVQEARAYSHDKFDLKSRRKLGCVNITASSSNDFKERMGDVANLLYGENPETYSAV